MQVLNWSHVIAVKDLDAAVQYYRDVLGFDVKDRGIEGWRWFSWGRSRLWRGIVLKKFPPWRSTTTRQSSVSSLAM